MKRFYLKCFLLLVATFAVAGKGLTQPTGAINGLFSVAEGQYVCFSKGNLQYQASTNTWRFADNQYDVMGSVNGNISSNYSGWIDLFGWGTSGFNHGAVCYQPWSTSTTDADYYAYGEEANNLYDGNGQADWGYNKISNGGNQYGLWRTLTVDEWNYILNGRSTNSGYRYVKATVDGVHGLVLLPDSWNADVYTLGRANAYWVQFEANVISASDWTNVLEAHGAVFLPVANYRSGSGYYGNDGSGYYKAANPGTILWFYDSWMGTSNSTGVARRPFGCSVRLVRSASQVYTISTGVTPSTGGTVTGAGNYMTGALCTLHATPNGHYTFVRWTKNGSTVSTNPTYNVTVSASENYVAEFAAPTGGTGQLNGLFSIAENTRVNFSKGNLQYQASTQTWRFAMNQYECMGVENENVSSSYGGWIDLFGWGTSGYNHGAACYQPYSISNNNSDYYAYGQAEYNLYDQSGKADWGYNAISNGGNSVNSGWRTLTAQEWYYLFNTRNTISGIRYAKATVNGISGVILLPDDWNASFFGLEDINNSYGDYINNQISDGDWTNIFEIAGAVFLPAVGRMISGSIADEEYGGTDAYGYYWSSYASNAERAYGVMFHGVCAECGGFFLNDGYLEASYPIYRNNAASVRLVRTAQNVSYNIVATPSPTAGGVVSGQGSYTNGSLCTLTASANDGYAFVRWTKDGNEISTNPSISFMVTETAYYVAEFSFVVSGSASPSNGGTVYGYGNYSPGATATLVAQANTGYTFDHWTENGAVVSVEASYSFKVNGGRSLVAVFVEASGTGKLSGAFSVGEGTQVSFSRGNLQYQASTNTWRFATNQYDMIGNTNNNLSETYSGWIDLFGWGTSNYNHGAVCYQPWSATRSYSDYYPYGGNTLNLFDQSGLADWGRNAIINGSNSENSGWRTLTHEEWQYLFNDRNTASGILYAKAIVNNINGVILLPDDWNVSYYSLNNTNTNNADYTGNTLSSVQWTTLEQHGAVFLPAAGQRNKVTLNSVGTAGFYWSSSCKNKISSWDVSFDESNLNVNNSYSKYGGLSVRLVRPSQNHAVSIQASQNISAGGTVSGSGSYMYGSLATVKASPKPGYIFIRWTENGTQVSINPEYSFTVTNNRNLVAVFSDGNCTGLLNGVFSVSENTRVSFSRGNLQYRASTNTWRFALNQYDCVGEDNENISQSYNGWIDLFGWGTSGFNHGAVCYQPWSTSYYDSDYCAYGQSGYWLCDQTGQADWGYNAISNGGNQTGQWRTLTPDDWTYLLSTRPTESGLRWIDHAVVNGVNGVILLPDDWSTSYYSFESTEISASLWNTLEQYGAVFLPAAGERSGASVGFGDMLGYYWTNANTYMNMEWSLLMYSGYTSMGYSVRLARTVPNEPCDISVSSSPSSGGTVSGGGTYQRGQNCTLTATANTGYSFVGWKKDGEQVSSNPTYTFTVSENAIYTAEFALMSFTISATTNPSAAGSVNGTGSFEYGSNCTLTALPSLGYSFAIWTENGSIVSTNASYSFTVTGNRTLVANYTVAPVSYSINASASPSDGGTVTGYGTYEHGQTCTLTATPNSGYNFVRWTKIGSQVTTNSSFSFVVTENSSYVAEFEPITKTQTLNLASGWNWVSVNVEITLDDLKAAILAADAGASPVIKSKNNGQTTYNGAVWVGGLKSIDLSQMYEIKVANACSIMLEGVLVNPEDHPVTLKNGANWIAYPLTEIQTVTNVFSEFPTEGDNIKSKTGGQAAWNGVIWTGALKRLEPGKGYIYTSTAADDRTFVFPASK